MVTKTEPRTSRLDRFPTSRPCHSGLLAERVSPDDWSSRFDGRSRAGRRTRARRLSIVVALVGLAALGAAGYLMLQAAESATDGASVIIVPGESATLSFVGDTLLGDEAAALISTHNAAPVTVAGLVDFGVDAVSLANNHAMDRGRYG